MGFRVLLIAVSGKDPATIHDEYSVEPTNQYEEVPESPVTGAMLPSGAYLLYVNDEILPKDRVLVRLSQNASLMTCYVNETVGNSLSSSWIDGVEEWCVFHDAQQAITHLEASGSLPDQFMPIRERLLAEQRRYRNTDVLFDVPVELFAALGGIRYNEDIPHAGPKPWQVLVRMKKKWWPFGR